ncbi:unnamed protein product [Trichobilharzia regenti]|nr:unnamed protein product [Trichobilharzia regenti]
MKLGDTIWEYLTELNAGKRYEPEWMNPPLIGVIGKLNNATFAQYTTYFL